MTMIHRARPGYIFLITVLVIGVIAMEMVVSLTLLGIASEQGGQSIAQSAQAYEYARTCVERGLRELRLDLTYDGGAFVEFSKGSCAIRHTAGSGNLDRALCVEGRSGRSVRRMEVAIGHVYPTVRITSWNEVSTFTSLCPP